MRNISVFFFALYFKAMPNSKDFYKGIFFHVIPVRIIFLWLSHFEFCLEVFDNFPDQGGWSKAYSYLFLGDHTDRLESGPQFDKKPMYLGCYVMYFKLFLTYTHLFITISNVICFNPIAIPIPNDCVVIFSSFYKNISGSCQSNQDEK